MTTENSCCGSYVYERCWPGYSDPEVGHGYFSQTTYTTTAIFTRVEDCSGTPCSAYNVFGGCNTHTTGSVFRRDVACCLGNNSYYMDPSFSDEDGDGWCYDRDCNDSNPNIHTGCSGGGSSACLYVSGSNGFEPDYNTYPVDGCSDGFFDNHSGNPDCCIAASPILVDVSGNGFDLSGLDNPVGFDFVGNGQPLSVSWTASGSDDAFLVLDRNGNGTIDDGAELFGNFAPQPPSTNRNGFIALAEYDKPGNGGNGDGVIDRRDTIFSLLRLWQDANHDGISAPGEVHTLPQLGVRAVDLDYRESRRVDRYGNRFRYRAKVYDVHGASVGRWAWDVFFVRQ